MRRLDFSLTNPSMMFRWSRARDREEPGAGPRVVRGAGESGQQQDEVWRPPAGRGRAQPGVRPPQRRRLHAEADQHQGRPRGRQLDGDGALNIPRRESFTFSGLVSQQQNSSFLRNLQ